MTSSFKQLELTSPLRYGFAALFEDLERQGVSQQAVLNLSGLGSLEGDMGFHERAALFRAAQELAIDSETALRAGQRQQISNYGAYGYALASSETLADAWRVGRDFFSLSGAMFKITLEVEGDVGVWRSHDPDSLGMVLPFVAEYWRSSQSKLFSLVLGRRFPTLRMAFPYPAPSHARLYQQVFRCPVSFGSGRMEWHFDANVLSERCVSADPDAAALCERYCAHLVDRSGGTSALQRDVMRACVGNLATSRVRAPWVARSLNMSVRTLYRRLQEEGISFQALLDRLRLSLALEYLRNTDIPVEEIGARCGYRDASNFRKAFKRWTGRAPSSYRHASLDVLGGAISEP